MSDTTQLPALPEIDPVFDHPEHEMKWTKREIAWIKDYATAYAMASLASVEGEPVGFLWRTSGSHDEWRYCPDMKQCPKDGELPNTEVRIVYTRPQPAQADAVEVVARLLQVHEGRDETMAREMARQMLGAAQADAAQGGRVPDADSETVPLAWRSTRKGLVAYVLQDELHNRLTPRVIDIAYSAFMSGAVGKNKEDGGKCDWFNDTKPMVLEAIGKIQKDLLATSPEPAAASQEQAQQPAVLLVRDVAEMIGVGVPDVCKAFVSLGGPMRSTNMAVTPDEAVAVSKHLRQQPAQAEAGAVGAHVADAELKALYVAQHGDDDGWLGQQGSYFISGVQAARANLQSVQVVDADRLRQAIAESLSRAARDVLVERERQISSEGWAPEHDDEHRTGELAAAAACYALAAAQPISENDYWRRNRQQAAQALWPWDREWWKPSYAFPRRMMVKAAALALAEIERHDRAAIANSKGGKL